MYLERAQSILEKEELSSYLVAQNLVLGRETQINPLNQREKNQVKKALTNSLEIVKFGFGLTNALSKY